MNPSKDLCSIVHPYVLIACDGGVDLEDTLLQLATCAATEYAHREGLTEAPLETPVEKMTVEDLVMYSKVVAAIALHAHKAMTEVPDVTH